MQKEQLISRFQELYGTEGGAIRTFFAPGIVNLIGDHTDYNGGRAFPFALNMGIYAAARLREDKTIHLSFSGDGAPVHSFRLDDNGLESDLEEAETGMLRFPRAVINNFISGGYIFSRGFDILYDISMPIHAGFASHASLEVLTGLILRELFALSEISSQDLALICREKRIRETDPYCGITDTAVCVLGKRGHGVFLAPQGYRYEYIPLNLNNTEVILTNTMVYDKHAHDKYLIRHTECEKALKKLKVVTNINYLCDLSMDTFNSCKDVIMNEEYTKRARHAVSENARTIRAVSAIRVGNLKRFGELMNQSHISLRDDYEVTCPELDFLAETAWEIPGVLGSRMTGGGLGGYTVTLVEKTEVENYKTRIAEAYRSKFGLTPEFYPGVSDDGAREI